MLNRPCRTAAIHDLSGFGRCSLSVILPVLSVMGIQVVPLPTAVLSTHTGGFQDVVLRDLSDFLEPSLAQYQKESIDFECVYTGFMSSESQIDHACLFVKSFPKALIVVDPVMGDQGKRYRTYSASMCARMKDLVRTANIITPNVTEASILLDEPYSTVPWTSQQCRTKLLKLSELGPEMVVITGVQLADLTMNNVGYDRRTNSFWRVSCSYVPVNYPGTGDLFCSILVGAYLNGDSLPIAMDRATCFLEMAIKRTFSYGTDPRYGVSFEPVLAWLSEEPYLDHYESL